MLVFSLPCCCGRRQRRWRSPGRLLHGPVGNRDRAMIHEASRPPHSQLSRTQTVPNPMHKFRTPTPDRKSKSSGFGRSKLMVLPEVFTQMSKGQSQRPGQSALWTWAKVGRGRRSIELANKAGGRRPGGDGRRKGERSGGSGQWVALWSRKRATKTNAQRQNGLWLPRMPTCLRLPPQPQPQ